MSRRNFTRNQKEQIIERSKNALGQICCEKCKLVLAGKPHEIDHIIAEGLRPASDKLKPLTISEGQLLGMACCHRGPEGKTKQDVKRIAEGKRQYNKQHGLATRKTRPIRSAGFPRRPKPEREPKQHLGPRALFMMPGPTGLWPASTEREHEQGSD